MLKIWALLFGAVALVITGSLIAHQSTANHIFIVLEPGLIGGIFLTMLNVLYIPNYLISALSYFVGTGFGLGSGTVVAPLTYKLGEVPPIPENSITKEPSAELLLLRGIMRYGLEDFGLGTDSDLIAATVLDSTEGYAPLFQHFTALLGGRPDQSRLRPYFLSVEGLEDWPATVISFALGIVPPEQLLVLATQGEPAETAWHTCEANFYISQLARVAGNTEEERRYLAACVATNQPHVAEFWVAKSRLEKLRATQPATPPARTQRSNRI